MHDDIAASERPHGITEDDTGRGLHDVFHEFRIVGILPFPFFRAADALRGDTLASEFIRTDLWLYIGEVPSGEQCNKKRVGRNLLITARRI